MRIIIGLIFCASLIFGCQNKNETTLQYVLNNFELKSNEIIKIGYRAHRIDTLPIEGNLVVNIKGEALIERNKLDEIFGFSFYGKRFDLPTEFIYDDYLGFIINKDLMKYEIIRCSGKGFIGSPGGQMVVPNIFYLDSIYENLDLAFTDSSYILKYKLLDNLEYNITNNKKEIELDKTLFVPIRIKKSSLNHGRKFVSQISLAGIKINGEITESLTNYKKELVGYKIITPTEVEKVDNINHVFPAISLPNLSNDIAFTLEKEKLTLIDFWEVWCGSCIKSLPEIELLKTKYPDNLQIIGIVTEDQATAINIVEKKGVTFMNLFGTKKLHSDYGVNSFPSYFLIDRNGIIIKEYRGFSMDIENDIKEQIVL